MHRALIAFSAALLLIHSSVRAASPEDWTPPQWAQASLFTLVKTVTVTPSGNYQNADFVRIGYVPGSDRFIVTFGTQLSQPEGECSKVLCPPSGCFYPAYAYKEYTTDMVETGKGGIASCHATSDTGGFFNGNDFYLASAEIQDNIEGWNLAKFNAVTWASSVDYFYSLGDSSMHAGDPTVALVNGQIDISSGYDGPGTHHNFFTTDLQFVSKRILSDLQHVGFSSMISLGGTTWFLSSMAGDPDWSVIVMQYDPDWTYRGVKTLREHAATPQGLAYDGTRFYVAYTDRQTTDGGMPLCENVHLAAFDTSWNLVDDIPLTSFTLQDQTNSIHPWLVLKDNRLYVSYSQNAPAGGIETLQAYVKVFDLSTTFTPCTSFTISPTSASATASAGSQSVTVTGSPTDCGGGSWTASANDSWLSVSPSSGSGSTSLTVSWTQNSSASPRSGTVTIAGNAFSVGQTGAGASTRRRAIRR